MYIKTYLASTLLGLLAFSSCNSDKVPSIKDIETLANYRNQYPAHKADNAFGIKADSTIMAYITDYPKDTLVPQLFYESAIIHHVTLNQPDAALVKFQTVYESFPKHRNAPNALFSSAFILSNTIKDTTRSNRLYRKMVKDYPDNKLTEDAKILLIQGNMTDEEFLNMQIKKREAEQKNAPAN
ncbi:MAG: hypothetical protein SGJ04_01790 [Bacteroidota bacterium]|nr:hypothetical protein [Bacteroidota bacterium]